MLTKQKKTVFNKCNKATQWLLLLLAFNFICLPPAVCFADDAATIAATAAATAPTHKRHLFSVSKRDPHMVKPSGSAIGAVLPSLHRARNKKTAAATPVSSASATPSVAPAASPVVTKPVPPVVVPSAPTPPSVPPVVAPAVAKPNINIIVAQPPSEFKPLLEGADTIVDVYYGGQLLGEAYAHYTDKTIRFANPAIIVDRVPNLQNRDAVLTALSGDLSTHGELACSDNAEQIQTNCGTLQPEVAGVIFNSSLFRADLFIAPNNLATQVLNGLLPNSDADFSYVNNFSAVTSGNAINNNTNTTTNNNDNYNFITNNTVAYQNARINADFNYSNSQFENSRAQWNANQLNAGYNFSDKEVQGGIIASQGNTFVSSQTILGASFGTTLNTVTSASTNFGSLLQIFLPTPSTVNIYKDGSLLSSQRYPMGNQVLNTANLPNGAYQVTIEVIDSQGNRTTTTRFFAKTNQIPPAQYPQYYLNTGYLEKNQFVSDSTFPGFEKTALYQAGFNVRLLSALGVNADVTGAGSYNFLTLGTYVIGNGFQFGPQVMGGTHHTRGAGLQAQTNIGRFQSTWFAREVWGQDNNQMTTTPSSTTPVVVPDNDDNNLAAVDQTSTQASANLSYQIASASLGFNSNVIKYPDAETIYSYGPSFQVPLYSQHNTTINFNVTATKSQSDLEVLAQFTLYFTSPHWIQSAAVGYKRITDDTDNNATSSTAVGDLASYWQDLNEAQQGIQVGVQGHSERTSNTVGSTLNYVNNYFGVNASSTHNFAVNGNLASTQYSATAQSHFAYADAEAAIGGGLPGDTGVIVYIASKHSGDKFEVYVNDQLLKIVSTNHAVPIFLPAYAIYKIRIRDASAAFYEYDEFPQTVTLYQGNIRALTWTARTKTIVYGQLVQPNGQPLGNHLIEGGVGPAITEKDGSFQLEVYDDTTILQSSLRKNQSCAIILPTLGANPGYVNVHRLTCESTKKVTV